VKILTTVKKVNNPDAKVKISSDNTEILVDGEKKLNDFDEWGVEEAIRIKEAHGGEVVVVSVGSKDATKELRTAMAMGADRGILVEVDPAELDSAAVAQLLAAVVEQEEPDIVTMGKLAVDTENNQVGQRLAALLEWPQATFAYSCEIADGWATVEREVDGGTSTVRLKLPGVVTADLRLNTPRYASLPGIMKARSKRLDVISADDLGVDFERKLKVVGYEEPPARAAGRVVEDVAELVDCLVNEAKAV